jgi:hypothetical protein
MAMLQWNAIMFELLAESKAHGSQIAPAMAAPAAAEPIRAS